MEFKAFPKVPRLRREMVVTEKIDGTNACVVIGEDGKFSHAQSRNRNIVPGDDNAGFAVWCEKNKDELEKLGPGYHYGEWYGSGIQCGYGLTEKRFALFNTGRWKDPYQAVQDGHDVCFPKCCEVVPVLYVGEFSTEVIDTIMNELQLGGSHAVPGFMSPEGVMIFHTASGQTYKRTFEGDAMGKERTHAQPKN